MSQLNYLELAINTFETIQKQFPNLHIEITSNSENVDCSVEIPLQEGLDFEISLNLQNTDELHIWTRDIWCSFFPMNKKVIELYINSVSGLIKGEYRILKFTKNDIVYKSLLQRPLQEKWETIFSDYKKLIFPWTKLETQIIQNNKHIISDL